MHDPSCNHFRRKMPNSKNQGFIVAEFYDGIQVIPKSWLQSDDVCKYPSHYKTDLKIRKAIEKEEIPTSNWSSVKIDRIFGEYSCLCKADEKAKQAFDTSDMDTDKETRTKKAKKLRAKKAMLSSESEEESREIILPRPPRPPAKRQRPYDGNESGSLSMIKCSRNSSAETYSKSEKVSNSNEHKSRDHNSSYSRNEERHNSTVQHRLENEEDISNRHVDKMDEIGHMQDEERLQEKRNDNLDKSSQNAIVDYLKRLTREIVTIKYDMWQTFSLLDILVKRTNSETEAKNTEISFESVEDRFPLQTAEQLMEVEEILKLHNSQDNAAIRAYIKSIGGTNVTDAVKRTLYKLFTNKLAEKYNWEGRCGKEPLHKLKLIKMIFSCVLQNIPNTDHGKIQRRIMEWFRHSKARHQNEEKRKLQGNRDQGDGDDSISE
ncbi:uncharacterized protein LOC105204900 isoform X2 [Solenopsis invicta]|uniref:uncharacterized protein LOC105204900 isoform X2 n=1 Tax=Solenopsis invicta TaxID=13686 RepID=UPI000E33F332|nr:uncharacterized protein LOC105204900 isoform X2 [Solenopsis invicta]XP_039304449.1 uncharacterized protein LOC105204900 isoform X2 [Solenopsis invicta]